MKLTIRLTDISIQKKKKKKCIGKKNYSIDKT